MKKSKKPKKRKIGYVPSSGSVWTRAENIARTWKDRPELIFWLRKNGLILP